MKTKSPIRIYFGNLYYRTLGAFRRFWLSCFYYMYNSFVTHFPSYWVRNIYLKKIIGISIGKDTSIHMGCFFSGNKIEIGHNTVIGRNSYFDGRVGRILIGDNVSIAPEAYILSLTHDKDSTDFSLIAKDITIQDYVWIGARVLLLPGVHVGKGAVIGAGSVVTKSVDSYDVVAGNPAKKISVRKSDLSYQLKYFPLFNTDI